MLSTFVKKFESWFGIKHHIEGNTGFRSFEEGQIWFCYLGENVGHEECGKGDEFLRPVVVIKKFNKHIFYGLPTSTKHKDNKFYYDLKLDKNNTFALMSQLRVIDSKRLKYKLAKLPDKELLLLKQKFCEMIMDNSK
jgi:mRNA interferase MazF